MNTEKTINIPSSSKNESQATGITGLVALIGIPTFFVPYMGIATLASLNLPTEIFAILGFFIGIIETIKTALYILIVINVIPTVNV